MFIINRKRISIVILCVFISIFSFILATTNQKENNIPAVPTVATPVSGKTIVVDAGHGVPDERCTK